MEMPNTLAKWWRYRRVRMVKRSQKCRDSRLCDCHHSHWRLVLLLPTKQAHGGRPQRGFLGCVCWESARCWSFYGRSHLGQAPRPRGRRDPHVSRDFHFELLAWRRKMFKATNYWKVCVRLHIFPEMNQNNEKNEGFWKHNFGILTWQLYNDLVCSFDISLHKHYSD